MLMRKLCPNFDREDGLETVLEVPIPEEVFASRNGKSRRGGGVGGWMRLHPGRPAHAPVTLGRNAELQLLLGVIAAPLVPLPIPAQQIISNHAMKGEPTEASMAKYIVKQYVAASGGDAALDAISSMYAMGKVRMTASEFRTGSDVDAGVSKCISGMGHGGGNGGAKKSGKGGGGGVGGGGGLGAGRGDMGGFVLWQKKPDLWCLELVVSGCKISAGSDGKVAWRQTPWHQPHASRGPPRPLRRSLQGLDPRSTANLFANAVWIGEKTINGDDCFVLKLDADPAALRARSSNSVEIIRHTVWGYFSHRTGLLVQLEDTHMLRIKAAGGGGGGDDSVYWETSMESVIEDYRPVDGVNIAHAGRTAVSLFRFGDSAEGHTRTRMEEAWTVEEVDFNIWGLSMECFLPPSDLKKEQQEGCVDVDLVKSVRPPPRVIPSAMAAVGRIGASQVAAIESTEESSTDSTEDDDGGM
ncbi:hypothetical protein Taro_049172 [Colocasia esculenta]|uniref:Uncharacterized protein n=1 Tax=Colocasia esculenta TaxID=4460 RepID=A0A843XA71_COLES|nr:hypothetical protein [Colocasia esculenta]